MTCSSSTQRLVARLLCLLPLTLAAGCSGGESNGSPDAVADCQGAKPWPDAGAKTSGLSQCEDGIVHRKGAPKCTAATPPELSADDPAAMQCEGVPCAKQAGGFCVATIHSSPELNTVACVYPCAGDEDCAEGTACFCGPTGGECIPAGCRADADCDEEPCILMFGKLTCGTPTAPELTCRVATRDCSADADCSANSLCIDGSCTPKVNTCG